MVQFKWIKREPKTKNIVEYITVPALWLTLHTFEHYGISAMYVVIPFRISPAQNRLKMTSPSEMHRQFDSGGFYWHFQKEASGSYMKSSGRRSTFIKVKAIMPCKTIYDGTELNIWPTCSFLQEITKKDSTVPTRHLNQRCHSKCPATEHI